MTVTISITVIFQVWKCKKCQLIPGYKAPHFEQNMIFPSKSTTITINSVLMPVNRCNFRKIWSKDSKKSSNMNHLPTFGHKNLFLIFKTVTANYSLMLAVWYNFKKSNQKIKNRKKISTVDFGTQLTHSPHFGPRKNFFQNMGSITFMCLLNPTFIQKNLKKIRSQSWEKGVTDRQTDGRTELNSKDSFAEMGLIRIRLDIRISETAFSQKFLSGVKEPLYRESQKTKICVSWAIVN